MAQKTYNNLTVRNVQVRFNDFTLSDAGSLVLTAQGSDNERLIGSVSWQARDNVGSMQELMENRVCVDLGSEVGRENLTRLMDDLWTLGIRPSDRKAEYDNANAALKKHIQFAEQVATKLLDKVTK